MILERFWTFSIKAHYYPAYHIGEDCSDWTVPTLCNSLYENVLQRGNSIICCAKEARASIVLNIEWVQFVLKNCAKLHSVRGLYAKNSASTFTSDVMFKSTKGSLFFTPPDLLARFCKSKLVEHKNSAWLGPSRTRGQFEICFGQIRLEIGQWQKKLSGKLQSHLKTKSVNKTQHHAVTALWFSAF